MKAWQYPAALIALTLVLRFIPQTDVLTADEVDALSGGAVFAAAHESGASLKSAFETDKEHPRARALRRVGGHSRTKRADTLTSPLTRWLVGGAMLLSGSSDLDSARWIAALAMALSVLMAFFFLVGGSRREKLWLLGLFLCCPGFLEASGGAGAAALGSLVITCFLVAMREVEAGRSPLWAGLAWGLCLAVHPAAIWLLIPLFVVAAQAYRLAQEPGPDAGLDDDVRSVDDVPSAEGQLRLPTVPLSLFLVPVVGLAVLVALWPTLWSGTGAGTFYWLTESWREAVPAHEVAGMVFDQAHGRAPLAWSGLLQWASMLPIALLVAYVAGVWNAIRASADGVWTPILVVGTLILAGGINGGLFGGRMSLLSLLLVPTLITAVRGVDSIYESVARRVPWEARKTIAVVSMAVFGGALLQSQLGATNLGAPNGAETRIPVPVSVLRQLQEQNGGADHKLEVAMAGGDTLGKKGRERWKHAIWTLSNRTDLNVALRSAAQADWLLVIDAQPVDTPDSAAHLIPDGAPKLSVEVAGVRWDIYKL